MILTLRNLKNVDRLAGKFKIKPYDLAHHSYYTVILFQHFAKIENIEYGIETLELIMNHDALELVTADLNYCVKNLNEVTKKCWEEIENQAVINQPEFEKYSDENIKKNLTARQFELFKVCDYLELFLFIHEEIQLGNKTKEMVDIYNRCDDLIKGKFKSVDTFIESIKIKEI